MGVCKWMCAQWLRVRARARARVCACVCVWVCVRDWRGVVLVATLKQPGMPKAACMRNALLQDHGAAARACPCGVAW